ncbi:MAG: PAS domain S-box protein [Desulfobacterales bacterium]|nr:PAS domain S-box protein [Desulfobacterales bacterium]
MKSENKSQKCPLDKLSALSKEISGFQSTDVSFELNELTLSILDSIPHALIGLMDRRVIFANKAVESIFGWRPEELIGKSTRKIYRNDKDYEEIGRRFYPILERQRTYSEEFICCHKNGSEIICLVSTSRIGESLKGKMIIATYVDINRVISAEEAILQAHNELELRVHERTLELNKTNEGLKNEINERRRVENALRESERLLAHIIDFLPDATFAVDLKGRVITWNQAIEEMTGISAEYMLGKGNYEYALPFYGIRRPILIDLTLKSDVEFEKEYFFIHKERDVLIVETDVPCVKGENLHLWGKASPIYDSDRNIVGAIESIRDITERKRMETQLQKSRKELQLLSAQLLKAHEDERKRVARDLHDTIAQNLATIKVLLNNKLGQMGRNEEASEISIEAIIAVVQGSIEEIRRIMSDLRPPLLDDLGILAAIKYYCLEFQEIHKNIYLEDQIDIKESEIPPALKIVMYRILQEALNNIVKHSQADSINLLIQKNKDGLEMVIADNGIGFDSAEIFSMENAKKGLGLIGMKERAELSNGSFAIESKKDVGTTIRISWHV